MLHADGTAPSRRRPGTDAPLRATSSRKPSARATGTRGGRAQKRLRKLDKRIEAGLFAEDKLANSDKLAPN
ncbi:hypothetical protein AB0P40_04140, partial [Streptomyces sp. NPDC079189]|uniref:hypothetical protein n=1 Tax=Streptomyces sp. NPDC079189 TaxID=3154514 RepID=UPI00341F8BEE